MAEFWFKTTTAAIGRSRWLPRYPSGVYTPVGYMTMTKPDLAIILGGLAAIAWVNWYFLFAGRGAVATAAPATPGGKQHVDILVRGGYTPATIRVAAGREVELTFDRQETSSCSEEVVFPDFGIRKFLPANEKTTLTFTPNKPGTYEFTCGMSMLHGRVIAE